MPEQWNQEWSTAVFFLEERDRRWKKVRDLMARDGIDVLVCPPCTNSFRPNSTKRLPLTGVLHFK